MAFQPPVWMRGRASRASRARCDLYKIVKLVWISSPRPVKRNRASRFTSLIGHRRFLARQHRASVKVVWFQKGICGLLQVSHMSCIPSPCRWKQRGGNTAALWGGEEVFVCPHRSVWRCGAVADQWWLNGAFQRDVKVTIIKTGKLKGLCGASLPALRGLFNVRRVIQPERPCSSCSSDFVCQSLCPCVSGVGVSYWRRPWTWPLKCWERTFEC